VKVVAACVATLLVLGSAGVAVAIKVHHDNQVAAQHRRALAAAQARARAAAKARADAKAKQQAQQAAEAAQHAADVSTRQEAETELQGAITKDATSKANQGLLVDGPAQSTTCTPVSGGSSQNLSESSGTYSCIAVYQTHGDGTESGYSYTGTINFSTGNMTWRLGSSGA
jgi:membrane protein involved in colicin uptake